jgi:tRNA1(Val) A37 N6-methylase TrmN6
VIETRCYCLSESVKYKFVDLGSGNGTLGLLLASSGLKVLCIEYVLNRHKQAIQVLYIFKLNFFCEEQRSNTR